FLGSAAGERPAHPGGAPADHSPAARVAVSAPVATAAALRLGPLRDVVADAPAARAPAGRRGRRLPARGARRPVLGAADAPAVAAVRPRHRPAAGLGLV